MSVVSLNKYNFECKVFTGILYNSGVKVKSDEVQAYIRMRFPKIYEENKYSYSKAMLGEIEEIFGKKISSKTIRPLLKELKPRYDSITEKEEYR